MHRPAWRLIPFLLLAGWLAACSLSPAPILRPELVAAVPVRFLLTFDDGPSAADRHNSTALILDTLARNRWQNDIKAIFFVQTRNHNGGGTDIGRQLLQRMQQEGHLLALHTALLRGHVSHTRMSLAELDRMLEDGAEDIRRISGDVPRFVRPPHWFYNAGTLARYEAHGFRMLLDDITIRDGKVRGITANPRARSRIRSELYKVAQRIQDGAMPAVSGYIPLVMTMHDTNPTTARNLESYLGMLIEEAQQLGLRLHPQPFIAPVAEAIKVASVRANRPQLAQTKPLTDH